MSLPRGIKKEKESGYSIYYIEDFTEEMKSAIREKLREICHGPNPIKSDSLIYSYKETAKEFIRRYKKDGNSARQKGMIGELLAHLILEIEGQYTVASPFFNLEEQSFKKGFDISLYDGSDDTLWFAEVKSGSVNEGQNNASTAAVSLINKAKNSLKERLNSKETSLWMNAINDARVAMDDAGHQKEAVIRLLEKCANGSITGIYSANTQNVVLIGMLFHPMKERMVKEKIANKYRSVIKEKIFNEVIIIAIQEETFETVYDFIESESMG